jgi:hypothetical protein
MCLEEAGDPTGPKEGLPWNIDASVHSTSKLTPLKWSKQNMTAVPDESSSNIGNTTRGKGKHGAVHVMP